MAVVAAMALGAGGLWWWSGRSVTPEAAAQVYIDALMSGETAALENTGFDVPDAAARALATAVERVSDGRVDKITGDGDERRAQLVFTLGGDAYEAEITLARQGRGWMPAPDAWGSVQWATTLGDEVALGGSRWMAGVSHSLLPAVYETTAAPADFLTGSTEVTVLPGIEAAAAIDATIDPAATAAIQEALNDYLAECASAGTEIPTHCGIRIPWATEFVSMSAVQFAVQNFPQVSITEDGQWRATDGTLDATIDGISAEGSAHTVTYRTQKWNVAGSLGFDGDDLVLRVR